MSFSRPPRMLSQRTHQILQDIRRTNEHLRQADSREGFSYRAPNLSRDRMTIDGRALPLHIGPEIDLTAVEGSQPKAA